MKKFHAYPVLITQQDLPHDLFEYDLSPIVEFDQLRVVSSQTGTILHDEPFNPNVFLRFPMEWGEVTCYYFLKGNVVSSYRHDLHGNTSLQALSGDSQEEATYKRLKAAVQVKMDKIEGSSNESNYLTDLIKRCVIDVDARQAICSRIRNIVVKEGAQMDKVEDYVYRLYSELYGLGVIQALDDDEEVGEIMVNATEFPHFQCTIYYIKRHEKILYPEKIETLHELRRIFLNCIAFENKELNSVDNAIIEANRPNKDRVNILIPNATEGWTLNIRKFGCFVPDKENMMASGTVNDFIDDLFEVLVKGKANIGIGGPMGTGKTTMINYMLTYTPKDERKMVIASVAETDVDRVLKGHDVIIGKVDEEKGFTFGRLLKASLRTTSDRVIIPESRGEEFKDLYEANVKTKGNMFTAHANDDKGFIEMCVDMYMSHPSVSNESSLSIRNKLTNGIDIVVMMTKVGRNIRIKSISEILTNEQGEYAGLAQLYRFERDPENPDIGQYRRTEHRLSDALKNRLNEIGGVPYSRMKDL